jgi:hypothetical protein
MQMLTCGCFNCLSLSELAGLGVGLHMLAAFLLPVVSLVLICSGASAMVRRRNRSLALTGCWMALTAASVQLVLPLAAIVMEQGRGNHFADPPLYCASVVVALALGAVGFVGGVKGLTILNEPEVIQAFSVER